MVLTHVYVLKYFIAGKMAENARNQINNVELDVQKNITNEPLGPEFSRQ